MSGFAARDLEASSIGKTASFLSDLGQAKQRLLMLDYDGTLAPFNIDPARAYPYPGVCVLLDAIAEETDTRIVFVTGRTIQDLLPLLALRYIPEIWGSQGWERRTVEGGYSVARPDPVALEALVEADHWSEGVCALGARREQKAACLAIHWRGLPSHQIQEIRENVQENWALLAQDAGLTLHDFDGGLELRVPGQNKGTAVQCVLNECGAHATAAYLGDDMTDEDAFHVMRGRGLAVLVREAPRSTAADIWLKPPHELLAFLEAWLIAAR